MEPGWTQKSSTRPAAWEVAQAMPERAEHRCRGGGGPAAENCGYSEAHAERRRQELTVGFQCRRRRRARRNVDFGTPDVPPNETWTFLSCAWAATGSAARAMAVDTRRVLEYITDTHILSES